MLPNISLWRYLLVMGFITENIHCTLLIQALESPKSQLPLAGKSHVGQQNFQAVCVNNAT